MSSQMELCKKILQSRSYWICILKVGHIGQFFWKVGPTKKKIHNRHHASASHVAKENQKLDNELINVVLFHFLHNKESRGMTPRRLKLSFVGHLLRKRRHAQIETFKRTLLCHTTLEMLS